ncbi:sensor histidine kinase [Leucobacter sp. HY1910]
MQSVNHDAPFEGWGATWAFTLGSIVFFFVVIDALLVLELTAAYRATGSTAALALLLATIVASAVQIRFCWFLRLQAEPRNAWVAALLAPATLAWGLGFTQTASSLLAVIPLWLACALLTSFAPKPRQWLLIALAAVIALIPTAVHWPAGFTVPANTYGSNLWLVAVYSAAMPFMLRASLWWWGVVTRLAERMLDIDPAAAAEQVEEIRLIAKQALEETPSLVAGLREVALEDELENARDVLSLAGTECALQRATVPADPRVQRALAFTVREGTTNILRHSNATRAAITLRHTGGACELELTNNGATGSGSATVGSGLAGLRSRVEELGGTLSHELQAEEFSLRVRVPARAMNASTIGGVAA